MNNFGSREQSLEYIERLCEAELDERLLELDDETFLELSKLISGVLERERQGFDRFFESISQTLKYIPNFLVLAITNKYIEPPIAARITSKLPLKNALQIAKGLSVEYIKETAIYLEEEYAAQLLAKLPAKTIKAVLSKLSETHPLRVLDIFEHASNDLIRISKLDTTQFKAIENGLNEVRLKTLNKLSS